MTDDALPTLLDADRMRTRLGAIPVLASGTARLGTAALERLWIKPGRHLHAAYRVSLETDRGPLETRAAAGALRPTPPPAVVLRRAIATAGATAWTAAESSALVDDPPLLVQLFPWDFRLPTLPGVLRPESLTPALGEPVVAADPVGYWPGMRCQIRYTLRSGAIRFGKVFPDDAGAAVADLMRRIHTVADATGGLRTPRVVDYLPELQLLVTEPVAGTALYDRLRDAEISGHGTAVASALAAFHGLRVDGIERVFGPVDDLAVVRPWVALVARTFTDLETPLAAALAALEHRAPGLDEGAIGLVHRDFYDKQVLIDGPHAALLDLDTACRGHAEIDVGNLLAHLVLRGLEWQADGTTFAPLASAVLGAYERLRPETSPALVRWYRAAALLRLACVYAVRPWWRQLALPLLEESRRGLA